MNEPQDWLVLGEVADRLGLSTSRVRQLLREGHLVGARVDGEVRVPANLLAEGEVVKGLTGTITLLRDTGYGDDDILRWLNTPDETLPGTPIDALRRNRGKEVKRRAQSAGF